MLQGATIQRAEETGVIRIARVMHGGAADRSGLIHMGDEVHEVNGVPVCGKPPDEVVNILVSQSVDTSCSAIHHCCTCLEVSGEGLSYRM